MVEQKLEALELEINQAIIDLIRKMYRLYPSQAIEIIDRVVNSTSTCRHDLNFVRFAMSVLSKNNRLDDARNIGAQYFSVNNSQGPNNKKNLGKLKAEYDDICFRCEQGNSSSEPTPRYYDAIYTMSDEYKKSPADSVYVPAWKVVVSQINQSLNFQSVNILDIGCGPGQFSRFLQSQTSNLNYLGIDTSPVAISHAQQSSNNCEFICTTLDNLDQQILNDIDLFLCLEVLEHIEEDLKLIKAIPSGKSLIFSVPNFDSFGHMRFFQSSSAVSDRYSHLFNNFSIKSVRLVNTDSIIYVCQGVAL